MKNYINKYTVSILIGLLIGGMVIYKNTVKNNLNAVSQIKTPHSTIKAQPLQYSGSTILNKFNKKNVDNYQTAAGTYDLAAMASTVTNQILKAFSNTTEKVLPLVANWNAGIPQDTDGLDPIYMIDRLANGEHILPSWKLAPYYDDTIGLDYYETSIKKAAELGLPLVFILPSPESALTKDDVYFSMDKTQNPNVITTSGIALPKLSPFGPDALWNEVGEQWSSTSLMAQLQEWYPNPPLILFVDEDSSSKLSWSDLSSSSRYDENYPTNSDNEFKSNLVNAAWLEKYRQLHEGFKQGFTKDTWKNNIKFLSRNQLASNMGKTSTWLKSATTTKQYANIWPLTTDALTINIDLDDTTSYSDINNLPFMLDEAKQANPNFTYELSINANLMIDNPEQYRGLTQFALWFLRPSIIRQTPNQTTKNEINPLFQQVVDSVDLVNENEILTDFWKNGKLLKTGDSTLRSNVPEEYKTIPRWFLLKTDSNQKVFSFVIEKGEAPTREWLVYAESPESNLTDIIVTIPDFDDILIDANQEGNLYTINETTPTKTTSIITTEKTNSTSILNSNSTYVSPYLKPINIPEYNSSDSSHVLITPTNGNWSKEVLNNPNKKNFYIKPGSYLSKITLTQSGTKDSPRTISLYNNDDIHPASLNIQQVANIRIWLHGASYWILDRLSNINDTTVPSFYLDENASNNIFNRLHIKNYRYGFKLRDGCNNNTIQNSYLDYMTHIGRTSDDIGIAISGNLNKPQTIKNTHIINNDIRDANDGIQLVHFYFKNKNDYQGTIIDSNNIWMDGDVYTNGDYAISGYNYNGNYQIGENAIDIKTGSYNPNNPIIISNNNIWGYRTVDNTAVGSNSAGLGTAVVIHFGVGNIKFNNNIISDSQQAFTATTPKEDSPSAYSLYNAEITDNIFSNINIINPTDAEVYAIALQQVNNVLFNNNILYNIKQNSLNQGYFFTYWHSTNSTFNNNIVINSNGTPNNQWENESDNNYFYHSLQNFHGTNDHIEKTIEKVDISYKPTDYQRFTNKVLEFNQTIIKQ